MKRINWIIFALAALGFAQGAAAVQPLEMDNAIVIESDDPLALDQLVVTGRNFDNGQTIQLTLGGTPLPVLEHTATVILADIPANVLPGSYVLVVWSGGGSVREDSMDVTVGAEGPAGATGPQGPEGPEGIQGPAGPQGEQGLTGSGGRDGTSCTVLDDADGATIACTDGTIASVADGAQGLQGETGPKGSEGVPGPQGVQGEPGLPGVPGRDGKPGADGLSCWDLNNNGVFDEAQEDIDLDRKGTVLDCRGRDGQDGEQGPEGERGPPGPGLDYLNLTIYSPVGSANVSTSANLRSDIIRLCGDNDGCFLRLISEMPDQSNEPDRAAILFLRVSTTSGFDEWRSSSLTAGGEISSGETRDGVVESLALGRSCRLQDSFTEPDGPIIKNYGSDDPWLDNGLSAYELVNVAQPRGTTCRLYITD